MNARIRELVEQCHHRYSEHNIDLEKFAEMIIQTCITLVDSTPIAYDDYRKQIEEEMRNDCRDRLKNHFGVEEQVQDSKELHTCPYRQEIYNDYESLCDCDEEQQRQCAMDI